MKLFYKIITAFLLLVMGLIVVVQTRFVKDKLCLIVQEMALQRGIELKIGKLQGILPFKVTLSGVHLKIDNTAFFDAELVRVRISIMGLLRKQVVISYFSADQSTFGFYPKDRTSEFTLFPLTIRTFKLKNLKLLNLKTQGEEIYNVTGNGRFKKGFLEIQAKIQSEAGNLAFQMRGNQKRNWISTGLKMDITSEKFFAPFFTLPAPTAFRLKTDLSGPWETWSESSPMRGELKIKVEKLGLPELHGLDENLFIKTQFALYSNAAFDIHSLFLKSDLLCIKADAKFDSKFLPTAVNGTFLLPHLSRITPFLGGIAKGEIHYDGNTCHITASSDHLDLQKVAFQNVAFDLEAELQEFWKGSFELSGSHPDLGFQSKGLFSLEKNRLSLENFSLQNPISSLQGDLAFNLPELTNFSGGFTFQFQDLAPYSTLISVPLGGHMGGNLDFREAGAQSHIIGKNVKIDSFVTQDIGVDLFFRENLWKVDLAFQESYYSDIHFKAFSLGWNNYDGSFRMSTEGTWKEPFDILTEGRAHPSQFTCTTLTGHLLQKRIHLEKPFNLQFGDEGISLEDLDLTIEDGYLRSSFKIDRESSKVIVQAEHFPLDFISLISPRLSFQGLSSIDINLEGVYNDLTGHIHFLLERADILAAGSLTPIQTKASLQGHLNHDTLQLHTHIVATGEQFLELSATFPIAYQLFPFKLKFLPGKMLAGQCTVEGHVEQLFDFINFGTQRFGGFLSSRLVLSGTTDRPALFGPLSVQGGFYKNYFIGLGFKNASILALANGNTILAENMEFEGESGGSASASGIFHLEPKFPFTVHGKIDHFRVLQFDWITALCSGPFSIVGSGEKAVAEGKLEVDEAEIHIPEQLPADIPTLPITFINRPETHVPSPVSTAYPFYYELDVHGEKNIHLTGRGLEANLAGDLHISGKNLSATAEGSLHITQGVFSFAGKDFTINHGEITFSEAGSFVNIISNLDLPDLVVTVKFQGTLTAPQLTFQSNPPLSTNAILSRILFNKDVAELSAAQIVVLAHTLMTLSGGPSPITFDAIRKSLGIDRLSIGASEETGGVSLQVGKSFSNDVVKGVTFTLEQGTESSHGVVEFQLKGGFIFQAETQEDSQGKFTFKWNKNY